MEGKNDTKIAVRVDHISEGTENKRGNQNGGKACIHRGGGQRQIKDDTSKQQMETGPRKVVKKIKKRRI